MQSLNQLLMSYELNLMIFVIIYVLSTVQPAKRHAYAQSGNNVFTPVERELVFDIVSYWTYRKLSLLVYF